ncbi:PEPxxWA-CTERM sorting domain-containing protein [Phenylobacterium sp.]|uniref:PEPxxWA-CTERM sorting domain-containing protein n=1 Tax=Phenylobacterium sp. TaxID=1871053 RepID=UPI00301D7511
MKIRNLLLAAVAVSAIAGTASAAVSVNVTSYFDPDLLPTGQVLLADFNNPGAPETVLLAGYTLTLSGATVGVGEGDAGYSGTLPNDPTNYLTVPGGATATFTSVSGFKAFSLYMGSPDTYNSIRFIGDGFDEIVSGANLFGGDSSQDWNWGARVNFSFGGAVVKQVILSSSANSFEVDNAAVAAVPEPATWAMMIMGFGAAGAVLRQRRRVVGATFA